MYIPRAAATAAAAAVAPRFAVYYDQWHPSSITKDQTAGITHVITAFAQSTLFTQDPPQPYTPFVEIAALRELFDEGTQICMAIGGWGDTAGFSAVQGDEELRKTFAKGVASTVKSLGYDCVGMYPLANPCLCCNILLRAQSQMWTGSTLVATARTIRRTPTRARFLKSRTIHSC